jgi:hypothetical protein
MSIMDFGNMGDGMAVIWPIVIQAFATLGLYVAMSRVRVAAVKAGRVEAKAYKYVENEPEETRNYTRALANQFESPVLFYAACLVAFVTQTANPVVVACAWGYALAKLVHMVVHATSNRLRNRRPAFIVAFGFLVLLWAALAVSLALR